MKTLRIVLSVSLLLGFMLFYSCGDGGDKETTKEARTAMLVNKTGGWTATTVIVPAASATVSSDWEGSFKVNFTSTSMSTSGHPSGASAVWPSGSWSFKDENATIISRSDGVEMNVLSISESSLKVQFTVPDNVHISGRVEALGGGYTFTLN